MSEYRWDLHYRKVGNEDKTRCEAVASNGDRCEYVVHSGHAHDSKDGSHGWLDRGFEDTADDGILAW